MEFSSFSSLAVLTTTVLVIVEKLHHKKWSRVRDENEEASI